MKLFLLQQCVNNGYDTYDTCVVCAETEDLARRIHPKSRVSEQFNAILADRFCYQAGWVMNIFDVEVTYLGEAQPNIPVGVVCESFKAG